MIDALLFIATAAVNAVIIGFLARRILGAPVGWPRTIAVSLVLVLIVSPLFTWALPRLGITPGDSAMSPETTALAAGVIVLLGAWVFVLEIIVLAVSEAIAPTGSLPSPLQVLRSLPARRRRGRRYLGIMAIATRHGLGSYFRPMLRTNQGQRNESHARVAVAVREAMTEAGVTFVKLGQMLATRPDLLPEPFVRELSRLHSSVPAEDWPTVRSVIEAELGRPCGEVFATIDETPLAAASVAQIHTATLLDGTEVVVKVQRTRARRQVLADLDLIDQLARRLERNTAWARNLRLVSLADGFGASLMEELDYRVELANMQSVAAASSAVRVPTPYPELSSAQLLVMERMAGEPLSRSADRLAQIPPERRTTMAKDLFSAVLRQVMVTGVFHADLHPGNIVVLPSDQLALLDLGSVGRLDQGSRTALGALMLAVDRGDSISATDALIDLLDRPTDLDDRALEREVGQLVLRYGGVGGGGVGSGGPSVLFGELTSLVVRHRFSIPPAIAAAFRALGALEGSLRLLTDELDLVTAAREEGQALMGGQLSREAVRTQLENQLGTVLPLVQRLPRRINRITEQLEDGRLSFSIRVLQHPDDRAFVTDMVQQLVVSVLAAALGLAGVLLVVSGSGPTLLNGLSGHALLGAVLLLFAFVLGSRALVLVFRQSR